jgi:hypothetical protein
VRVKKEREKRRKFVCRIETMFTCIFWVVKEDLSDGKGTDHDMLEGIHCLVVYYDGNEACVSVKQAIIL